METVITNTNIDEVLAGGLPVLIDFWATWCGPCRILSSTVDDIAAEYEGRVVVAKCNVDDCEDVAVRFGVRNIPTLLFLKNGVIVDRAAGLQTRKEIAARLDNIL